MRDRHIIAVGGGKGGVGKTLASASLGIALAQRGRRVILIDADLGGANLHTCLAVPSPEKTLSHFMTREVEALPELIVETGVPGLGLISGARDNLEATNPLHTQKMRLVRHFAKLDCDDLVLDLGAGTGFNVLDFYIFAEKGVLVVTPEPTSEENAYRFIKAAYLRRLRTVQRVYGLRELLDQAVADISRQGTGTPAQLLDAMMHIDPEAGHLVEREMQRFRPYIVINQSRSAEDEHLGEHVQDVCRESLGIQVRILGTVPYDDMVWRGARKRKPLMLEAPSSKAARAFSQIAERLLQEQEIEAPVARVAPTQFRRVQLDAAQAAAMIDESGSTEAASVFAALRTSAAVAQPSLPPPEHAAEETFFAGEVIDADETLFDGAVLRARREARGISLEEVAVRTKIPLAKLAAIEADDYEALDARVFLRGFVFQFARLLGLDGERSARAYLATADRRSGVRTTTS